MEPQQGVVVKVRLLHASLFEADLPVERRRQAKDDAGLHLRGHTRGIDANPAVHRADDAVHANPVLLDRHFRHLRHEAAERLVNRDTAEGPLGERVSPTGFFGGQVEDAQVARMVPEQPAPILQRVELRGPRQLVHEALHDEAGMRMADRTPPEDRDARLGGMQADPVVRDRLQVGGIGGAFDGRSVHALLDHHLRERGPLEDGLADDRLTPGDRQTIAAEARVQPVHPHRPVVAAAHVVFAGPDQLHRPPAADLLGDLDAFGGVVGLEVGAAAERAAGEQGVDGDRARQVADDLGGVQLVHGRDLRAEDHVA